MNIQDIIENVIAEAPLFTWMILRLKPQEKNDIPTIGTDGEVLVYNKKYLNSLTLGQASATVLHEIFHCAFGHIWRRGSRNQMRWNIAADYSINGMVAETFPLPPGSLFESKYQGLSAEEIYDLLPDNPKYQDWCSKGGWGKEKKKGKNQSQSQTIKQNQTEQDWKKLFEKTIMKNYGKIPGNMKKLIQKSYYRPVIDWMELVKNFLSEDMIDYSFSVRDRRFLDQDYVLPDMYSMDRLKDIVFAYDTSGSVSDEDLFTFYMETLNLFNNFVNLTGWIAICDTKVYEFSEINSYHGENPFNFVGRGGTDFEPVFKKVDDRGVSPKALFYFTDCEGDFPTQAPNYPVFWLVRGDKVYRTPNVPFGQVITFKPKSI